MVQLTETEERARAKRDLYAVRYSLTVWGLVWRSLLCLGLLLDIATRLYFNIEPNWWTIFFAAGFVVCSREIWDGFRRRRFDRWKQEKEIECGEVGTGSGSFDKS